MFIHYNTVTLRAIEREDMEFCRELINSSYIEHMTTCKSAPVSMADQLTWFENCRTDREIRFIVSTENGPIGIVQITAIDWINRNGEIGIKFHQNRERTPAQTADACEAFLAYLFDELNIHCVYAYVISDNLFSVKLLNHYGFSMDGTLRDRVYKQGRYQDLLSFSLLESEYRQRQKAQKKTAESQV